MLNKELQSCSNMHRFYTEQTSNQSLVRITKSLSMNMTWKCTSPFVFILVSPSLHRRHFIIRQILESLSRPNMHRRHIRWLTTCQTVPITNISVKFGVHMTRYPKIVQNVVIFAFFERLFIQCLSKCTGQELCMPCEYLFRVSFLNFVAFTIRSH